MAHEFIAIHPPRSLTPEEKGILDRLLSVDFQGRDQLLRQRPSARVTEECTQCHSIVIAVDNLSENAASVKRRVPVHAQAMDSDNGRIHILLHVVNGFIDEMELYREDLQNVKELPKPNSLEFLDIEQSH